MSERVTLEELLGNDRWLRALARRLTGGTDADDAVQETWLAASRALPERGPSLRPWLATVLRNVLRMRARADGRRSQREAVDAPVEPLPGTELLVERVERERELAALVLSLAEPYRTTLLLRFYEGLSAAAIGRRLGVPAGTVRWRVKEALDQLRRKLDDRHRDRRTWSLWLAPIAKGGLIMKTVTQAALVILLLLIGLGLGGALVWHRSAPPVSAGAQRTASRSTPVATARPSFGLVPGTTRRDETAAEGRLEGRVLSLQSRQGIPEATLSFAGGGAVETTLTDGEGRFRFVPTHEGSFELVGLSAGGFVPQIGSPGEGGVRFAAVRGVTVSGVELFLEPVRELVATVFQDAQRPVPDALVRVDGGGPALAPLTTDSAGQCRFAASNGMLVEASFGGRRAFARVDVPALARGTLRLELGKTVSREAPIRGLVLDADDRPVSDARVTTLADLSGGAVAHETSTAPNGRFAFEPLFEGSYLLIARAPGRAPAVVKGVRPGGPDVTLRLSAGGTIRGSVSRRGGAVQMSYFVGAESEEADRADGLYGHMVFAPDGRFVMEGVTPGSYRVGVRATGLALATQRTEVTAGRTVDLRFTLEEGAHVRGRVIDGATRAPIAGAHVFADFEAEHAVVTGSDGSFDLPGVAVGIRLVQAAASGYRGGEVSGLRVGESASLDPVTLLLRRAAPGESEDLEFAGLGTIPVRDNDGFRILEVVPSGGGAAAGLRAGDIMLELDGVKLAGRQEAEAAALLHGPEGSTVQVVYRRGDSVATVTATRHKVQ
jgi:RNA polymerase sigma-70 factor (ECF subfamily)